MRSVIIESLLIAIVGGILAFGANALSPRGLVLSRNYFPSDRSRPLPNPATGGVQAHTSPTTSPAANADPLLEQVRAEGLRLVDGTQTKTLFSDPRTDQGLVIFIDARSDEHYQEGHIPGAYQLDHFHPERYLASVLPVCQTAEQIIIYCNGGSCDDSLQTAIFLRDAGIPKERLFIYGGGITEWSAKGAPVETGGRKSGVLVSGPK